MTSMRYCLLALTLALTAAPVAAEDDAAEDAAFDDALKDFGYAGGAAWQCAEDAARGEIVENAMVVYNRLAQLFGTDRAFFFSAAFGAGSVDQIPSEDCAGHTADFADGLAKKGKEATE